MDLPQSAHLNVFACGDSQLPLIEQRRRDFTPHRDFSLPVFQTDKKPFFPRVLSAACWKA